jgi:flagellin
MSFKINTNSYGIYAKARADKVNTELGGSLEKLSSGLRINKAADDASGLAIANSLRTQASGLNQAIRNANDGIGLIQIADNAMEEMGSILNVVKTKSIQAAQDGQSMESRKALQADITKLMEEYQNISKTTSFNGTTLLDGTFNNKEFQIGAYSNQTIGVDIMSVDAYKVGHTRVETTDTITGLATDGTAVSTLTFVGRGAGGSDFTLESVQMGTGVGQGVGELANSINRYGDMLGVSASWSNTITGTAPIAAGNVAGLTVNGVVVGDIVGVQDNDKDGTLAAAINSVKDLTGVVASTEGGVLSLSSVDGRGIDITGLGGVSTLADGHTTGRLTLRSTDGRDINVTDGGTAGVDTSANQATLNLANVFSSFTDVQSEAGGAYANDQDARFGLGVGLGVTTREGAMMTMDIVDAAIKDLDRVRSDLGSTQNQMVSTINNITITQANVQIAESQIRDVDFASETESFNKNKLLSQAGTFALSQANAVQQNVLKLLQ